MRIKIKCPFTYADGHRCTGHISRVKAYGPRADDGIWVRKVRLWCNEKGDHCGTVSSLATKDRMEFYPDQLPDDIKDGVWALFDQGIYDTNEQALKEKLANRSAKQADSGHELSRG